jgi:MoxR-like ATPase
MTTIWKIFDGSLKPHDRIKSLGDPPPWRPSGAEIPAAVSPQASGNGRSADTTDRATTFRADANTIDLVNAALHLRRPLLITGKPGTGKSSLIYAVAHELQLGPVLRWSVTSRSTLQQGLYQYDAIGRFHAREIDGVAPDIGDFLTLGPLGTALLPTAQPRALLIDEIDKSDIDLPNDLLNIFEEGEYFVPELQRLKHPSTVNVTTAEGDKFPITAGHVRCHAFPFVVLTSNGEREFPPPFLRRCLRLDMPEPTPERIAKIVASHLGPRAALKAKPIIEEFLARRSTSTLATDQLLNAVFLLTATRVQGETREQLLDAMLRALSTATSETTT